jgi:hypothetical protein
MEEAYDDRVECRRDDTSAVECWDREEVHDSEIDRDEGRDDEDQREWCCDLDESDEGSSNTDRS